MKIEIVPYNPTWPSLFEQEKRQLIESLGKVIEHIHHIGSTAVEGLSAKPVIDIIIEASSLKALDDNAPIFKHHGYEVMGEFGIVGRRYYRKGDDNRTHQIHAFVTGDQNVHRHIAFRDYLRAHPSIRLEYQQLKIDTASRCNNDIEIYCDGKNDFIKHYETRALEWVACT